MSALAAFMLGVVAGVGGFALLLWIAWAWQDATFDLPSPQFQPPRFHLDRPPLAELELERIEIEAGLVPGFEDAVALELKDGRRMYRLPDGRVVRSPGELRRDREAYERTMQERWGDAPGA